MIIIVYVSDVDYGFFFYIVVLVLNFSLIFRLLYNVILYFYLKDLYICWFIKLIEY